MDHYANLLELLGTREEDKQDRFERSDSGRTDPTTTSAVPWSGGKVQSGLGAILLQSSITAANENHDMAEGNQCLLDMNMSKGWWKSLRHEMPRVKCGVKERSIGRYLETVCTTHSFHD